MGDCSFYINKLKFEIFNDKQNLFFSAISKNLNWEMLTKNLVSLGMGLRVKNFNAMGVHGKVLFLGAGFTKNQYRWRNCLKTGSLDGLQI